MLKPSAGITQTRSNLLAKAIEQRIVLLKKAIEMSQDDSRLARDMEKRLAEAQNDLRTLIEKDKTNE